MNNTQLSMIKRALFDVEMMEIRLLESFPQVTAEHSPEYTRKMHSVIERERKREASVLPWSTRKKVIVLIAAILIFALTVTACAYRQEIKGFFVEIYESFTRLTVPGEPIDVSFQQYTFSWVPDGYYLESTTESQFSSNIIWSNGKDKIFLDQDLNNVIDIDTEENPLQTVVIGEISVYYTKKHNYIGIIWIQDDYNFCLTCKDSIPWDDIVTMIQSLSPDEQETGE